MTDGLFNEHPDWMTGRMVSKPAKKRDMLFERLLSIFHPLLTLDNVPDGVRGRLNIACKRFREWPDFNMSEVMVRYGRMRGRTTWRTPLALANNWDQFADDERTVQPGTPSQASQDADRREREVHRQLCEREQVERDQARIIVLALPDGGASLLKEWHKLPESEAWMKHGYGKNPTDLPCVRWIAAEAEARDV